ARGRRLPAAPEALAWGRQPLVKPEPWVRERRPPVNPESQARGAASGRWRPLAPVAGPVLPPALQAAAGRRRRGAGGGGGGVGGGVGGGWAGAGAFACGGLAGAFGARSAWGAGARGAFAIASGGVGFGGTAGSCGAGRNQRASPRAAASTIATATPMRRLVGGRLGDGGSSSGRRSIASAFFRASGMELTTVPAARSAGGAGRRGGEGARRCVEDDARQAADPSIGEQQARALEIEHRGGRCRVEGAVLDHAAGARPDEERLEPCHRDAPRRRLQARGTEPPEVPPEDVAPSGPTAVD